MESKIESLPSESSKSDHYKNSKKEEEMDDGEKEKKENGITLCTVWLRLAVVII